LFLCTSLKISIKSSIVSGLYEIEDGAAAVLLADAKRLGLVSGNIDRSVWNRSLSRDGLNSSMWLYAYESTLKKTNGMSIESHVTNHQYFGPLFSKKIEFYRSGALHLNKNALLRRLRFANLRRRIQEARLSEDLGTDVIDFDDLFEEDVVEDAEY
jgi:hypothetical protein